MVVKPVRAEASQLVEAPPETVYRVLADYREHHPNVLPKPAFERLVVEKGGVGAGTAIAVTMNVMGARSTLRMEVTEPQPGRVLQETDHENGVTTTFTVEPLDGGKRSRLTIATEWRAKPGLRGWIERRVNPAVAKGLYRKQLQLVDAYARKLA